MNTPFCFQDLAAVWLTSEFTGELFALAGEFQQMVALHRVAQTFGFDQNHRKKQFADVGQD